MEGKKQIKEKPDKTRPNGHLIVISKKGRGENS